jgi:hypothetical protein
MMRDTNVQAGFPIARDKAWWFTSYRRYDIDLAARGKSRLFSNPTKGPTLTSLRE